MNENDENMVKNEQPRIIAFYLPQYHPIIENDRWWGKGFTEWTNVVQAAPKFRGHYQPQLPAELGFYDLRIPEVRQAQAVLARQYGIYGFCYYHYWFHGRRLLERPLNEVLVSGQPDFPFCLCWANEDWTRAWDGHSSQVLMSQHYSESDDRCHVRWLASVFADKRYIRVNGKPLFIVYRVSNLPHVHKTVAIWREEAQKLGIGEIYLCTVESQNEDRLDPSNIGFDAAIEFQPDWVNLGHRLRQRRWWKVMQQIGLFSAFRDNNIYEYTQVVENMMRRPSPDYKRYPCVTPSWDNSARRKVGATILRNSTPHVYEYWLRHVINKFHRFGDDENFVFINAWNEWAEGNHLEPCLKWGRKYLEATKRVVESRRTEIP